MAFDAFGITGILLASAAMLLLAALLTGISFSLYAKATGQRP